MSESSHDQALQGVRVNTTGLTVGEAGERETLKRVLAQLGPATAAVVGPGDDCAVLNLDGETVVTSDTMLEGADFRLDWHQGFELGWKLAVTNLSDVAAMGATPRALTASFACPASTPVALLEEISRGLDAACREFAPGCGVVGGDLARAAHVTAAITALGDLDGQPAVLRSGAREGQVIAYAGQLGLSGLGLNLLIAETGDDELSEESLARLRVEHPTAIEAHLAPRSPIWLGRAAARAGASAMLDVSDGLVLDSARIAEASGVEIDLSSAQLRQGFGAQGGETVALDHMLYGGEDHGMLAVFPTTADLPDGFVAIGRVHAAGKAADTAKSVAITLDGRGLAVRGWDPFEIQARVE